jgi:hypothetical protein
MRRPWALLVAILAIAGCKGPGASGTATDPFFGRTRVEPPRTRTISAQPPGSNLSQTPVPGALAPSATQGQTRSAPSGASPYPTNQPPQASGAQPNWTPAQPKVNSVPAAIGPQTSSGYQPPDGGFGFPGGSSASAPEISAGSGDRLSVPVAARAMGVSASTMSAGQPGTNPSLDSASAAILGGRERIVRVIEPATGTPSTAPRFSPYPSGAGGGSGGGSQLSPASDKPVNIADLPDAGS